MMSVWKEKGAVFHSGGPGEWIDESVDVEHISDASEASHAYTKHTAKDSTSRSRG